MWPLAHLLIEQQGRLVGEAGHHPRLARVDADGLVELDVVPAVVLEDRGMRRIEPGGGLEAVALAAGVAGFLDAVVRHRHLGAGHRAMAQSDQHRAAAADVGTQRVFERRGQRADIGEHHERVLRRDQVGGLLDGRRVDLEGRLAGGFERGLEVQQAAGIVGGLVHEQGVARIVALDREVEGVVGGQRVGGIDSDLALVAAVGHVERQELHGGAAALGHFDRLGFDGAPVEREGDVAGRLLACRSRPRWPARGPSWRRTRGAARPRSPP